MKGILFIRKSLCTARRWTDLALHCVPHPPITDILYSSCADVLPSPERAAQAVSCFCAWKTFPLLHPTKAYSSFQKHLQHTASSGEPSLTPQKEGVPSSSLCFTSFAQYDFCAVLKYNIKLFYNDLFVHIHPPLEGGFSRIGIMC